MSVLVQMDAGPQPSIGAAPLHRPAALTPQLEFLGKWRASIAPKLQQLLTVLAGREAAQSMACVQIWTYLPVLTEGRQILKAEQLCLLGDPELQQFHAGCAQEGVTVTQLGPMGKVWESGAVQVVQYAESLSEDTHPRNRLPGELSRRIGECIYLPVYDRTGQVSQGVLAVVELLVKAQACDYMIVANAISCLNHVMEGLQLSISNPHAQQPAAPPAGAAAGSRLGASGGADAAPAAGGAAATGLPHSSSSQHTNMAWGSRGSSGGSLGRTVSMHAFGA